MERYIIEIETFGKFEIESNNVLYALDMIRENLKINSKDFTRIFIISAFVIIREDFAIDITHILNGVH